MLCLFYCQNINEDECPEERMINLKFYLNEIKSSPDGTLLIFYCFAIS